MEAGRDDALNGLPGIALLRAKRADQRASFDEVADHLVDYARTHPDDVGFVDRLASFLARIEDVDHAHG